jgi:carbonic anhydrase/acetyltransferase-like protein (isoleucine patch superfamily)
MQEGSNVQDTCVMHGFPETDTVIEVDGHIGHGALLHGCRIKRNAMVGMNAVVMDNAEIGEESIVAALAFVKTNAVIPPRSLVVGNAGSGHSTAHRAGGRVEKRRHGRLPGACPAVPGDNETSRAAGGSRARTAAGARAGNRPALQDQDEVQRLAVHSRFLLLSVTAHWDGRLGLPRPLRTFNWTMLPQQRKPWGTFWGMLRSNDVQIHQLHASPR